MNRQDLEKKVKGVCGTLLYEKGYISMVDVLMGSGYLTAEDCQKWRTRKVPYLERVVTANLNKLNYIRKIVGQFARTGGLRPSRMVYRSWGKGPKRLLRFSRSGAPSVEAAYATHQVGLSKKQASLTHLSLFFAFLMDDGNFV